MIKRVLNYILLVITCLICLNSCESDKTPTTMRKGNLNYPITDKQDTKDNFFGEDVANPYQWLEDDNSESTKKWIAAQNRFTYSYIDKLPQREKIKTRLEELWSYKRYSTPIKNREYYYYLQNDGLQNQDVLVKQKGLNGEVSIVLDPNKFSKDGTSSLGSFNISPDGKYLAYQKSVGGSDWHEISILDLTTGRELADKIPWVKFSEVSWVEGGFYYARFAAPNEGEESTVLAKNQTVYFHKLGTSSEKDEIIYLDRAHPSRGFIVNATEDNATLIIESWEGTSGVSIAIQNNNDEDSSFKTVVEGFDDDYHYIGAIEDELFFLTNAKAPNKRILSIEADKLDKTKWKTIIEEGKDVIASADIYGNHLVLSYIHNASSKLAIFTIDGKLVYEVSLPSIGTVQSISGNQEDAQAFFSFTSFTQPTSIYRLDILTGEAVLYKQPKVAFESSKFVTKQIWYKSKDGTRIPMFVSHKKGLEMDGNRPTLLYGYGGFDISILPSFNTTRLSMAPIFMENDGIFVVANIRGGGEFGSEWHRAGTKENKQNVFDDFIGAAEHLIANNYTSSEKLAAYGRSNGGLLIAACLVQRPNLFKVALPAVGVLDMLHYEDFTVGWAWATDYGSVKEEAAYRYLKAYSPVHNVTASNYSATLITTAAHDDRVVPAHSFKFAAALQEAQTGDAPIMIRVGTSAGHGDGKSTDEKISEAADVLSFAFYNFGIDLK